MELPQDLTDGELTFLLVMVWYRQAKFAHSFAVFGLNHFLWICVHLFMFWVA